MVPQAPVGQAELAWTPTGTALGSEGSSQGEGWRAVLESALWSPAPWREGSPRAGWAPVSGQLAPCHQAHCSPTLWPPEVNLQHLRTLLLSGPAPALTFLLRPVAPWFQSLSESVHGRKGNGQKAKPGFSHHSGTGAGRSVVASGCRDSVPAKFSLRSDSTERWVGAVLPNGGSEGGRVLPILASARRHAGRLTGRLRTLSWRWDRGLHSWGRRRPVARGAELWHDPGPGDAPRSPASAVGFGS